MDLLPCPFCGGDAETENYITEAHAGCTKCGIGLVRRHAPREDTGIAEAARAWNTRALITAARRPDHFVDADDMVGRPDEWQPIETASKCDTLLLFGTMLPHHELSIAGAFIFTGYWDEIDSSWCSTGSTWTGPFFKATHWMPLPAAPKEGE